MTAIGYSHFKASLLFYDLARGCARIENDDPGRVNSRVVWSDGRSEEIGTITEADFYRALCLLGVKIPPQYPVAVPRDRVARLGPFSDDRAYLSAMPCENGHVGVKVGLGYCLLCLQDETQRAGMHEQIDALMHGSPDLQLSRAMASRYGLPVYRSGKPCVAGHSGWRYVSTASCVECLRARPRTVLDSATSRKTAA